MDYLILIMFLCLYNKKVHSTCMDKAFDYIVVGSGSSGAVVATRLSEDKDVTVLLLEAGKEPTVESEFPLINSFAFSPDMTWKNYQTLPQKNCCKYRKNNVVPIQRGKALGGTSSINGMGFTRGNKNDFNTWSRLGNPGWNYKNVLPYFLKIEDYKIPSSRYDEIYHSQGGPMSVTLPVFRISLVDAFLDAGREIGEPTVDCNAQYQTGFMYTPVNIENKSRTSTYTGYLKPVLGRPNLQVLTEAFVTKILIDKQKRATGVQYEKGTSNCTAKANKEVILSAGVFNSPKLLMLSGIGPKNTLKKYNISLVVDLPGVGENLKDHALVEGISYTVKNRIVYDSSQIDLEKYSSLWEINGTTPITCPSSYGGLAYLKTKFVNETDWPDIEITFGSFITDLVKPCNPSALPNAVNSFKNNIISFRPFLLRPKSSGFVTIKSGNPHSPPVIEPKYLSHPDDVATLSEGINIIWKLAATKVFQDYGIELTDSEIMSNCKSRGNNVEELNKCLIETVSSTAEHFCCTCKMGPSVDKRAVVDSRLRVHGVRNLRVADASIMPTIPCAHMSAVCMMIGEKVANMIKEDHGNNAP